ncbi:MAG: LLM class flavin-dependent oxidoreductase [Actinobacteria bacterium]|nr:LLM class flavin-dependent oxidoreductase [Actinomycetota bacterium]
MTRLQIHWFLPTGGDGRDLIPTAEGAHARAPDIDYLAQVARAADRLGFDGMLTPTGTYCEDAWLVTAALVRETERVKFLVAFRPGLLSPTLAAQMAATYQRMSRGRILLNVVTGAEPAELQRFGDWLDKDQRYERTGEFLQIVRGAWSGTPFDFEGNHYRVAAATVRAAPDPQPPIYFGGASPTAEQIAARFVDVYLAWGEPPAMVAERVERMRKLSAEHGRTLSFGIRFHTITRPTAAQAWAEADRLLSTIPSEAAAEAQAEFAQAHSVGQQRMAALHGGDRAKLVVHPNVWAGIGLVRGGAGTALVGSHEEVADRIVEYAEVGFDEFILSGYPHLEEAYWFGEGVLPILRDRGLTGDLPSGASSEGPAATFR